MAPYKRKSERVLTTQDILDEAKRKIEAGDSKRKVARDLGIKESTLRKRLKAGTVPVSLGRFKNALSDEMEKELAQHCKDLDNRFYGLTRKHIMKVAFDFAEKNGVSERFNQEKKLAGKDWLKGFCKRHKLSVRAPELCSVARAVGFNKVQVSRFFENLKQCRAAELEDSQPAGRRAKPGRVCVVTIGNSGGVNNAVIGRSYRQTPSDESDRQDLDRRLPPCDVGDKHTLLEEEGLLDVTPGWTDRKGRVPALNERGGFDGRAALERREAMDIAGAPGWSSATAAADLLRL
ncbi:uncharacterized protein LOC134535356 [Bacillus rossius redtenbacheri]|uniref:uncharacterized protein LOC134535356 n=1 Tax=Bacillus rossius redtenbacheri TaxID=93214 RepID=UPI002FDCB0B3